MEDHPFVEAIRIAAMLYTDEELALWLRSPQPLHDGWTPIMMLGSGDSAALRDTLRRFDEGVYL